MERSDHGCLLNPHQRAVGERRGRRDALHPSALDVEDGVGIVTLREDRAMLSVSCDGSAGTV